MTSPAVHPSLAHHSTREKEAPVATQDPNASAVRRITDAATILLRDQAVGRDRISLSSVARQAGLPIGAVYRQFSSRADLLDHVWPDRGDTYLPRQ